jgi:hypothetical protein
MRKIAIALLAVVLLAPMAQAQFMPVLDNFSLTLGAGTSVPARSEEFTAGFKPAFYRVVLVEYEFNDWIRTFGKYDRSIFDSQTDGDGTQLDFTAWGLGIMLFAPVLPKWDVYGKVAAESATMEGGEMEWAPQTAVGINYKASKNADGRLELGFKTHSASDLIESFTIHGAVNFHRAEL